ncbi:MAG: OmpH family outer membrane protein [Phycisphaerae bacterium]|jgi:Skp family chaperone for outer membrane proteins|nr:OmpH family outer membrane protein [Phycisphaerae bacterium]MBT5365446.1 OmpH family outer membrane protein [Phycisphaerae bacterium]MBT6270129.1 OmpH family outer membrane protein [Phycisphaerae bacterium]MBT6283311.1 OmpH family outer membrane protein [Phycisphaerae bacterium]
MRTNQLQKLTMAFAMTTVIAIVVGYAAVAASSQMRPPTVVVTFNIEQVTADLTERGDSEVKLRKLLTSIEDEKNLKFKAIEELNVAIESAADADRGVLLENLDKLKLSAISFQRYAASQIDIERSLMFRDLYLKIKKSVAEVADENGYDLVLISDNTREILVNPNAKVSREFQVREQIEVKRIMFASNQIDITEQIVTHMNLEWEKNSN